MEVKDYFSLDYKNLREIPFTKYAHDFTFIVDGKKFQTSRIVADLLSPIIRKLHFIDESINEFYIHTEYNNANFSENCFSDFLDLCSFEKVELNSIKRELFSTYLYKLGNIDDFLRIRPEFSTPLTIENAIERFQTISKLSENISEEFDRSSFNIESIISFISSHFEDFDQQQMKSLSIDLLEEILDSENLKITDEDSLFKFILNLYKEDHSFSTLFEHIIFGNLNETSIEKFVTCFELENINQKIWETICSRLIPKKSKTVTRYRTGICRRGKNSHFLKEFKFQTGREFDGIMHFLTDETGSNIHNNGTIEISSNSIADDNNSFHPKYLVDYQLLTFYESKNEEGIFICFDFKDKLIQLSSYSIKSHKDGFNRGNLRNWTVEVSNDGKNWIEIDRHENDSTLNKSNFIANFVIKKQTDEFYRFIRFHQIGYSWYGYPNANFYYLYFYFIEFFGKIQIPLNE